MRPFIFFLISLALFAETRQIHILDQYSYQPVHKALVSNQTCTVTSDVKGIATIDTNTSQTLYIKAHGYRQKSVDINTTTVMLEPFSPKALYLSFWAAGSSKYMKRILDLARETEINTVIVDIKNEFGDLSYKSDVALAKSIDAHSQRTIKNIDNFVKRLKDEGLYVIGRVVVFKDDRLARYHNEYALKDSNGTVWRNREKLAWVSPFETQVHEYVSDIAKDAASHGFDEINFDYVRFPLKEGLVYTKTSNRKNRIEAISTFLQKANAKLQPYNVYTSVDTYGYVCWNKGDTGIGHTIKSLSQNSDYIAPMLYPSGFGVGILGYKNPTDHPYDIIHESIKSALERADISAVRLRPWLQSFKDYGFDRKFFKSKEVSAQIKGAEHAACSGWMLWNPSSRFSSKGLQDVSAPYPILPELKRSTEQNYCFRQTSESLHP